MRVELHSLRQLIALAEHGSFVRAAGALHVSQPALSRSIRNLEQRFGNRLFNRTGHGVVPTDLGRLYIERARDLLRMANDFDRAVAAHGSLHLGGASVGGGPYPAESFLGSAAARMVSRHPEVSVEILEDVWTELVHLLRTRRLDFFIAETSTLADQPDLEIARLSSEHPLYFFARAAHPLAGRSNVSAVEAMAWPFATPSRIPPRLLEPLLRARAEAARQAATPRPFPAFECNGMSPVKRIVRDSDAISASILTCIARELESGEFVLLGTEPWLHLQYGIVSLRRRPWTQTATILRDYVIEAERTASAQERHLLARFGPRPKRGADGSHVRKRTRRLGSRRPATPVRRKTT